MSTEGYHPDQGVDVFNEACRDLPEGWEICIRLEQDSGRVELINPDGDEQAGFSCEYGTMEERIRAAIAFAKAHDHLYPQA